MSTTIIRKTFTALLCGCVLATGATAAYADRWDSRDHDWEHKKHHHHHHHQDKHVVYRETVVVREHPRYYRPPVVHHHYHERPYRSYSYSRSPAVVIGINIPPIVIPIR